MADLNLDLDYFSHPKTVRLMGILGRGSEVLPIKLWCYCGKYHAESGRLMDYSAQELEAALGWWGKPGEAVEALLKIGFLQSEENGFKVHDWTEYQGHIGAIKKRNKKVAKNRWENIRKSISTVDTSGIPCGNQNSTSGVPSLSVLSVPSLLTKETTGPPPQNGVEIVLGSEEVPKPYRIHGPGQQVVAAYKLLTGVDLEDRGWDSLYYPRFKKQAEALLKFFKSDVETCCQCMEGIKKWAETKRIDWTLDTCLKRAGDWRSGRLWKNG